MAISGAVWVAAGGQHALLQLLSGQGELQSIVAASFDENESVFREATAGLDFTLIQWEGKVIQQLPDEIAGDFR